MNKLFAPHAPGSRTRARMWLPGFYMVTLDAVAVWLRHARSERELHRFGSRDLADLGMWRIRAD